MRKRRSAEREDDLCITLLVSLSHSQCHRCIHCHCCASCVISCSLYQHHFNCVNIMLLVSTSCYLCQHHVTCVNIMLPESTSCYHRCQPSRFRQDSTAFGVIDPLSCYTLDLSHFMQRSTYCILRIYCVSMRTRVV